MKLILSILLLGFSVAVNAQFNPLNPPNDCGEAVPGCTAPAFPISPNVPGTNVVDFGTGTMSNPSSNPNAVPGNTGCLLTGETSSTFITISVVSSGTLAWSIQGPSGGCFDWIMWPYANSATTCAQILNAQIAPVACNWNSPCQGFTGMAPIGGLPAGANQGNFESALTVVAGQQFLLCLSNFSGTSQNVNLNFFGSANVACGVSAPDQTICQGNSATVNVATPGYTAPVFTWLVTTGVSNITSGTNVTVTPTVTTTYAVRVVQLPTANSVQLVDTAVFTIFVENPPVPSAGLDDSICFGSPIHLTGNISNTINAKSWTYFNMGISPTPTVNFTPNFSSLTPTITVNQPGTYGFILRETSQICGQRRDTVLVHVKQMTNTSTVVTPSCEGMADGQIQLAGPGASQYSYNNGASWTTTADSTGFSAGTYNVCVKDALGCQVCSQVAVIDPSPVLIATSNDTIVCQNGTATMQSFGSGGNSFNYHWSHTSQTGGTQYTSPVQSGYYYVYAENQSGCISATDSIYVEVLPALSGSISLDDSICPGYTTQLSADGLDGNGGPYTFTWSNGDVGYGVVHNTTVSPSVTQVYTVTITDACESTPLVLSNTVSVSPVPVPVFLVDANKKCEPAVFELLIDTDPATYTNSMFFFSDGQIYQNTDQLNSLAMPAGYYDVQLVLMNQQGCIDSVTYSDYLISEQIPTARFRFSPGQPTMFNTLVKFDNFSEGAIDYAWTFEKASPPASNETSPSTTFPDGMTGNYKVMLVATSDFGCMDTISEIVEVLPEVILYAPNTFTPDHDQFNQEWFVVIEGIDNFSFDIEVRDRWGNTVWQNNDVNGRWDGTYGGEILPTGTYPWIIKAKDLLTDKMYTFAGSVMILK